MARKGRKRQRPGDRLNVRQALRQRDQVTADTMREAWADSGDPEFVELIIGNVLRHITQDGPAGVHGWELTDLVHGADPNKLYSVAESGAVEEIEPPVTPT